MASLCVSRAREDERGRGPKHTDDDNVSVDGQGATPRDGAQAGPFLVHGAGSEGQELVENPENEKARNLREHARSNAETLNDEVGDVQVGGLGQVLSQDGRSLAGPVVETLGDSGGRRSNRGDEEDLNDLERKVGVLGEELDSRNGGLASKLGAD